jgi:methionyl-tRNA formyltransferase
MTIGVLASGGLGYTIIIDIYNKYGLDFVFTDKHSDLIVDFCKENNIECFIGNPRNGKAYEFIKNKKVDLLLSINYLFIVDKDIIDLGEKYSINFHGALLPKYRGRTPHVWAIINNEKYTGITAHIITEGCDEGDIVYQEKIEIEQDYTGADVLEIFKQLYPVIVSKVIDLVQKNEVIALSQDNNKATFFGKRTFEDGLINWDWQKERIRNWVRAQAHPYPGAFCFCNNQKIIIHKLVFSDNGYLYNQPNGLVVDIIDKNLFVKTSNGIIEISNFECDIKISINDVLHG